MHDIRAIRDQPKRFISALERRGPLNLLHYQAFHAEIEDHARSSTLNSDDIALFGTSYGHNTASEMLEAVFQLRSLVQQRAQEDETRANELARSASRIADSRDDLQEFESLRKLAKERKIGLARNKSAGSTIDQSLRDFLLSLPNLPDHDVPNGASEEDNVELRRWGDVPQIEGAREHFEIPAVAAAIGGGPGMDFETAATISGSRFVLLRGAVARVHRALAQFMLDTHVAENGLTEVAPPVLVTSDAMTGTDKLPKFGGDSFRTEDGLWLVPTAEVPLTYSVAGKVLDADALPIRMVAHTLCFRSEAGSAGRDTKGMLRQHQFEKVEMVSVTDAGTSEGRVRRAPVDDGERDRIAEGEVLHEEGEFLNSRLELERMTGAAEGILERLGLPYRTLVLCTGDMGFGARRTHDVEVWLPGQGTYREISSCSTTGEFQARRMNARYRPAPGAKPEFVHTLNGSGLAVGRCLIAVLENGQNPDGGVDLPPVLAGWLGGRTRITPEGVLE